MSDKDQTSGRQKEYKNLKNAKCKFCKQPAVYQWKMKNGDYIAVCEACDIILKEGIQTKAELKKQPEEANHKGSPAAKLKAHRNYKQPPEPVSKTSRGEVVKFWEKGNKPKESGWYLVQYFSNDKPPVLWYEKLWFNPKAAPSWWYQTGCHSMPWDWPKNIIRFVNFEEACDKLDRLAEEKEQLSKSWDYHFKRGEELEIEKLQAKNATLDEKLGCMTMNYQTHAKINEELEAQVGRHRKERLEALELLSQADRKWGTERVKLLAEIKGLKELTESQIKKGLNSLNAAQISIIKNGIEQHGKIGHYGRHFIVTVILEALKG